jgi:DNA ligase-1
MKTFATLFSQLDETTKTSHKISYLSSYFQVAKPMDKLWTIALFSGRRPKRAVTTTQLRHWAAERAEIPLWLFEDCYRVVGDLAEALALILPPAQRTSDYSLDDWIVWLRALHEVPSDHRKPHIIRAWDQLPVRQCFLFNKLITGGFRVGVSQKLMTRALAQATGQDAATLAHRLMGNWTPETTTWAKLIESDNSETDLSRPYPFYLAHGLEVRDNRKQGDRPIMMPETGLASGDTQKTDPATAQLGPCQHWRAEWKWDGIRGQIILRDGNVYVWSRGEELITDRFPEFTELATLLPDGTVLDGEILAWKADRPMPFNALQKRIGHKTVPKKLRDDAPVVLMTYDLLEHYGQDIRSQPYDRRRAHLTALFAALPDTGPLRLSQELVFKTWVYLAGKRAGARAAGTEGVMIKRQDSAYGVGRKKGDWWKWKLDPLTIDAVMIYAQAGHGRRATLYSDFTFALWQGEDLVPFTKAYSGLTDAELAEISKWVRKNTLQRFGPVRQVTPHHVFEIAFEGLHESPRHKSGVALRFPRMRRWRHDKVVQQANTLDDLKKMLSHYG